MGALRRLTIGLVTLCMALSLVGCAAPKLTLDPEELYALPELPERFQDITFPRFLSGQRE